jgi:hypothetical protein
MPAVVPYPEYYHYTSFDAALNIAKSRSLWATSVHYLNDEEEFRVGHRAILGGLERATRKWPQSKLLQALIKRLQSWEQPYVFVFSFSEVGDQLSQWRGYCPNGFGVSIGFPKPLIETRANQHGFDFAPCVYDEMVQIGLVAEIIQEALRAEELATHSLQALTTAYLLRFVTVAPRLKHRSFSEEREWRLISSAIFGTDSRIKYRAARSMMIPYYEFALADGSGDVRLGNVIIGPNPHIELAMRSVGDMLRSQGMEGAGVSRSMVPYRTW